MHSAKPSAIFIPAGDPGQPGSWQWASQKTEPVKRDIYPRYKTSFYHWQQAILEKLPLSNHAGYGLIGAWEALSDEPISKEIHTHLLCVLRVTQAFLPHFREKKGGLFISTTSIGGLLGFPLHPVYQATKFVIEGWSESRSFELGLHPIGIKTIAAGGRTTDCIGRSPDSNSPPGYPEIEDQLFTAVDSMHAASTAGPIADTVYEAATDKQGPRSLYCR